jgi:hypothetical protein
MQRGVLLEIFPDSSAEEEHWRFFQPASGTPHLVIEGLTGNLKAIQAAAKTNQ